MGYTLEKHGGSVFSTPEDFAYIAETFAYGDGRYMSDASKANAFSNPGTDEGSAIGFIEFTDRSYIDYCSMFRIEEKKGKYSYNNCKWGWETKYSKQMIPIFNTVDKAAGATIVNMCDPCSLDGLAGCVGYGDPAFNNKPKEEHFWGDAVFISHVKSRIEKDFQDGHGKKINSKKDLCPCVVVADGGWLEGDSYGYNSKKNSSTNYNRLGNFGYKNKLYIHGCATVNNVVYVYIAAPYYMWWQNDGVWEIFQGLKCNYETTIYSIAGWCRLDVIINNPTTPVTVYYPDENHPSNQGAHGHLATADANITDSDYMQSLYSASYNAEDLSPYVNIHSVIGMPFTFLANTDLRYGQAKIDQGKTGYGKEYLENIVYDMPIAILKPGTPSHDSGSFLSGIVEKIKGNLVYMLQGGSAGTVLQQAIANFLLSKYERFYTFDSQYNQYIQYVNTICHMFATFLGIAELDCPTALGESGGNKTYGRYDDSISVIDAKNNQFTAQFGSSPAIFCYYQPGSQLNHTFNTSMTESSAASTITDYSEKKRQYSFFGEMLGIGGENSMLEGVFTDVSDALSSWFGTLGEAGGTIIAGNNISLPEIWADSTTDVSHEIKIKLVSPYGDPECIFLHVLRPLARLIALALPQQTSQNSYGSPFVIQAFSKGQFNCQLGVVSSLSVTRGGEGGESHTIHHIPTELEVSISIQDMYEKVMLSNEYADGKLFAAMNPVKWTKSVGLLLNNIGLMDFLASYSGYNLNSPSTETQLSLMVNILKNRVNNAFVVSDAAGKIRFPMWERSLVDSFNNTVQKSQSLTSG